MSTKKLYDAGKWEKFIPSMNAGIHTKLVYSNIANSTSMESMWPAAYTDDEVRTTFLAKLHKTYLCERDVEFLIDRIIYKLTYRELADKYELTSVDAADYRYKKLIDYLKESL